MGQHKSETKKKKKDSQLVIRIEASERDAFVQLCDALDTTAAREIRRFMREWVEQHRPTMAETVAEAAPETAPAPAEAAVSVDRASAPKAKSARRKRAEPVEASP